MILHFFYEKRKDHITMFLAPFSFPTFVHPLFSHVFFQFESFVIMIDEGQSFIHTQLGRLGFSLIAAYSVHLFGLFFDKRTAGWEGCIADIHFQKGDYLSHFLLE